ncbi:MAG: hypothetical protein U1E83_04825 [Methylotetracoccus sp.]
MPRLRQFIPAIHSILLQRTSERFEESIRRLASIQRTADERLAGFLLDLSRRYQALGFSASEFRVSLTRQEIGDYLGWH